MITREANALFNMISKENLLQLASVYDKRFEPGNKNVEVAKNSLFSSYAFKRLLTAFNQVIHTNYNNTNDGVLTTFALELLDIVHDDTTLKERKKNFLQAFDEFVDPVVYETQDYTVSYYMESSDIITTVHHTGSTLLYDDEIIEEAKINILEDLRILMHSPLTYEEFEEKYLPFFDESYFEITKRDLVERAAKAV